MEDQPTARPEEPQFLTVKQAARFLNVSPSCVSRLYRTGTLSHFRFGNGRGPVRIARNDLLAFVRDCRVEKRGDAGASRRRERVTKPVEGIYEHLDLLPQHACGADTKVGTPCKRMTTNERCSQHSA